ncbi:prepilin-type N-terminal cleavage/methylation domain-containing protein, partial [Thioalkalivibrio sp. ALJ20]
MKQDYRVKQSGITLLEALISLVVISVGVLAIAKLYGEIMASTGESKARAEAIQIAESRVDSLRNALSQDDLVRAIDALDTPEGSPVQGVNANFHVRSDVDPTDDASGQIAQLDVAVRVVWEGMRENEEELGVLVSSDVLWSPPDHAVNLARGTLPSTVSIPDPSGEGRNFGEAIDPSEADSIAPIDDMDRNLERRTLEDLQQIVDRDTGEVLLETDNQEGFSMVSGFLVGVGEGASDDDGGGGGNQGGGGGGGNQGGGGGGGNQGGGGG